MPTSAEIDRALVKLETLAKERGIAVGVASALPISIERIGRLDQDARQPWHHACAIDNGDAEIKIRLEIKPTMAIRNFPAGGGPNDCG